MTTNKKVKVTRKRLSDYKPDPLNANAGSERGYRFIDDSITQDGVGRSGLVDKNGVVIAGNQTMEVLAANGIEDVIEVETTGKEWVVVKRTDTDLGDDDPNNTARRMAYRDNRATEVSLNWKPERLQADKEAGVEVVEKLWTPVELDEMGVESEEPPDAPEAQIDRAAELQEKWQVQRGDIWQVGRHRIMCGDSTNAGDVEKLMGGVKADAVVTDPPYGINQDGIPNDEPEKLQNMIDGVVINLPCDNAVIVCFQSPRTFPVWLDSTRKNNIEFKRMLWMYKAAQITFPWRGWILTSESILISLIGNGQWNDVKPYTHDCYYMSELSNELPKDCGWHGSVKPLHVISDLIQRVSQNGQVSYDPFLGSGTTLVACEQTGRVGYGMELHPPYVAVCLERLTEMGLQPERE
jgi:hypothetical protein